MVWQRVALILLVMLVTFVSVEGIDWTFWNDDKDSTTTEDSQTTNTPKSSKSSLLAATISSEDLASEASSFDTESLAEYYATPSTVKSTIKSTHRNWVGPWTISPDAACYREAHIMDVSPSNFDRNEATNTCWTECPMGYPVECDMECIQQNSDCGIEATNKVSAVAMSIFSTATMGVFGELARLGQTISWAVRCSNSLMLVMRGIIKYVRNMKVEDPQATDRKLLPLLYQTGTVVTDLPIAIYVCLGKAVPPNLRFSQYVLGTAQWRLMQVLANDDDILMNWQKFKAFLKGANFTEVADEITEGEIKSLETAMQLNSSCGGDLKSLTDRVWMAVNEYRRDNSAITDDEIRLKVSESGLVLYDVTTVTNNCMKQMILESSEVTAYQTRETLRKTFGVIINDLIKSGKSDNGTSLDEKQTAYKVIDTGLSAVAAMLIDPTRLTLLFSEYLQTVCGPTQFMGEIDDGTKPATLGLNTRQDTFRDSSISWTKKGDGQVIINFISTDEEDVTVNIMSGGDKIDEVDVTAGGKAQWTSTITKLGSKTLYLDRWRPGLFGLPGTGGGSLVLWVSRASQGGHLEIKAKLNVS